MIHNISYKTLIGAKPLCIRLDKVHGFIRVYDGTRYLALFELGKYCAILNRIRHLIGVKSSIKYVISHNYKKIKVDLYNSLPVEETLTLHNVTILTKSILNKDKNNCYYHIFLEKGSCELYLKITILSKFLHKL